MKARCEIRQQVMAAFFLVYYYGALRDSDKAEIIIDVVKQRSSLSSLMPKIIFGHFSNTRDLFKRISK
jgi:hypothetical protein